MNLINLIILLLFCSISVFAQTPLPEVIPPSPTAAELGKYGDVPVSMYTGIPNISVPIYTIQSKDITVPISLSYHAGGIKVEQEATWVGLGWSLNAGGVITKSVRGLDDIESSQGLTQSEKDFLLSNNGDYTGTNLTMILNLCDGTRDGEVDIFFYNFMGNSGKFIYDATTNTTYKVAKNDIEIKYIPSGLTSYWEVRTPDGFLYEFSKRETTTPQNSSQSNNFISSWYLSTITSSTGNQVNFHYKGGSIESLAGFSVVKTSLDPLTSASTACPTPGTAVSASYSITGTLHLDRITFDHGEVLVNSSKKRADLLQTTTLQPRGLKIDDIQVKLDGQVTHSIAFHHSFFSVPGTEDQINPDYTLKTINTVDRYDAANHRLRLDAVWIDDKAYSFSYHNPDGLPRKDSKSQDHWGFINELGLSNDPNTLIPTDLVQNRCGQNYSIGTSRDANTANSKNGLLSKILYPTGGTSEFVYESNTTTKQRDKWNFDLVATLNTDSNNEPTDQWTGFRMPTELDCFAVEVRILYENPLDNVENNNASVEIFEVSQWTNQALTDWELGNRDLSDFSLNDAVSSVRIFEESATQNQIYDDVNLVYGKYYLMRVKALAHNSSAVGTVYGYDKVGVEDYEKAVGGVRIKQSITHDGVDVENDLVKTYDYSYIGSSNSSGHLVSQPYYNATYVQYKNPNTFAHIVIDGRFACGGEYCRINESRSYSKPLGSTSGSHIVYTHVTEYVGSLDDHNGYTTNEFTYSAPITSNIFPFVPGSNEDYRNGKLVRQLTYSKEGQLVKEVQNNYVEKKTDFFYSIKAFNQFRQHNFQWLTIESCAFAVNYYQINSGFNYLESTKEIQYSTTGEPITTLTSFFYDKVEDPSNSHYQITKKSLLDSEDIERTTRYKYVKDYTFSANSTPDKMVEKNMVGLPIETIQLVNGEEVAAQATKYKYDDTNDLILPEEMYRYDTTTPGIGFGESTDAVNFTNYNLQAAITRHDSQGNVLEVLGKDGIHTSYVWGYGQSYPVAKIVNASYSAIETALGGTNFSLDDGNYLSDQQIQDVKNDLPTAQVTTYTFKPGIGIWTITDPNNLTTEYLYDDYGRLEYIKDPGGYIVKKYKYHYQNSPAN